MGNGSHSQTASQAQKSVAIASDRSSSKTERGRNDLQAAHPQSDDRHFPNPHGTGGKQRPEQVSSSPDDDLLASVDPASLSVPSPPIAKSQVESAETLLHSEELGRMQASESPDASGKGEEVGTAGTQTAMASTNEDLPSLDASAFIAKVQDGAAPSVTTDRSDQGDATKELSRIASIQSGSTPPATQQANPGGNSPAHDASLTDKASPSGTIASTSLGDSPSEAAEPLATAAPPINPLSARAQLAQTQPSSLAQTEQSAGPPFNGGTRPAPQSQVDLTENPPSPRQSAAQESARPSVITAQSALPYSVRTAALQMASLASEKAALSPERQSVQTPPDLGNGLPKPAPFAALQASLTSAKSGGEPAAQPAFAQNLASGANSIPFTLAYRPADLPGQSNPSFHGSSDQPFDRYDLKNAAATMAAKPPTPVAGDALLPLTNKPVASSFLDPASVLPIERASFADSTMFSTGSTSHSGSSAALTTSIQTPLPVTALAEQIKEHSKPGKPTSLELSLSPEELGKVRLLMTPEGDKIRIVIQAERPETLELMRRNTETLAAELRQSGYASTSFSFGGWSNARPAPQNAKQENGSKLTDLAQRESTPPIHYASPLKGSGLDLRV